MARRKSIGIQRLLASLISSQQISALAQSTNLVQRYRKIKPVSFFWALIIGFGAGHEKSLAGLRRIYQNLTGVQVAASSFYKRFSGSLSLFLKRILTHLVDKTSEKHRNYEGIFAQFKDVLIMDATIIRLHRMLKKYFPSCWTNHTEASMKLDLVISLLDATPHTVRFTEGRRHEARKRRVGRWVAGRLLLFDLGYFSYKLFNRIDENGGFFVSRLKLNANPTILKAHRNWPGRSVSIEGKTLREVEARLRRDQFDAEVEIDFRKRAYQGKRTRVTRRFRLVGVRNQETGRYHFYITNVPCEDLSVKEVAKAYEARWQIELLFKELKTYYRFDQVNFEKQEIVEALLYAGLITLIASRQLLRAVRNKVGKDRVVPDLRWASIFSKLSGSILQIVAGSKELSRLTARWLEPMLLAEAPDPNVGRQLLRERTQFCFA